jgi:hypothetical protein
MHTHVNNNTYRGEPKIKYAYHRYKYHIKVGDSTTIPVANSEKCEKQKHVAEKED